MAKRSHIKPEMNAEKWLASFIVGCLWNIDYKTTYNDTIYFDLRWLADGHSLEDWGPC